MTSYLCPRCGYPTEMHTGIDFEDGEQHFDLLCPHCNMEYEVTIPDEKPDSQQTIIDQGFGKCPFCGGYIGWGNEFMRSDYTGEELSEMRRIDNGVLPKRMINQAKSLPKQKSADLSFINKEQKVRNWLSCLSVFGKG